MLIAAQPLPSFLSALVLEQRAIFAAMTAGERIVLPEETFRIKSLPFRQNLDSFGIKTTALHRMVQGFGLGKTFFGGTFLLW